MSDVNANIGINFDASQALAQLRQLQAGLSKFNQALIQGNAGAMNAQKGLNDVLMQTINSSGKFAASQKMVATSTASFTNALEKNKFSLGQYFRYTAAAATANTKVFENAFSSERNILNRARKDRVKALQTQYVQLSGAQDGLVKVLQVVPKHLEMVNGKFTDYATRVQMAAQRQQFLNQLLKQGSTQLLNFGKNTQWAGRQLMVGLTIPLSMLGSFAAKTFRDMEMAMLKFTKVYGDLTTTGDATNKAVADIQKLAQEFTKYGIAVTDTINMAADAAAMGLTGNNLQQQIISATKLSVLGQVEQQQALETTISLQNAFGISADELAKKINFLNAVENQTVLSIEDLTIAVPKAGPVVKQLGGNVEDLAFFMTAMKEGGINASEGANALKSGLASIINPAKKTSEFLASLGINIKGIVDANAGDIKGTVIGLANALDTLAPLDRSRAIEQLFGKFQFARLSTLFQNVTKDTSQAARALGLAGASVEELAILSERELGKVENAVGVKFQKSVEMLKQQLVPVGKAFLEALTPIVNFFSGLLEKFSNFSDGTKKTLAIVVATVGGIAPVALMTFGVLVNGIANSIKFFAMLRSGMAKLNGQNQVLGGGFDYLTQAEIENMTETNALHMSHKTLIDTFNVEAGAVNALAAAYGNAGSQARALASTAPSFFNSSVGAKGAVSKIPKFAKGGVVPGTGNKDTVAAMLTPGEVVLTKQTVKENPELVAALQNNAVRKYNGGTGNNARSGMSYRGTHNLIMQRIAEKEAASQSQAITPESKLPEYLQREYDRINKLTESNLRRYADLTGQGVGKSLEEIKAIVLADFESLLAEVKTKFGSVTKGGLDAVGKKWDPEKQSTRMGTWAPKFNEPYGDSFAHVGNTENVSQTSSVAKLKLKPEIAAAMEVAKEYYAETGRTAPDVRVADAFGFKAKQYINRGMASNKQGNFEDKYGTTVGKAFESDFAEQGVDKWRDMTEMVGQDFDKIKAEAKIYDQALLTKIQSWNAENSQKAIPDPFTDDVIRNLKASVRKDVDSLIPEFKMVIESAKQKVTALRTSIAQDDLGPLNERLKAKNLPIMGTEASNAKYGNIEARNAKEILGTKLPEQVEKSLAEAERIAETASPSKRTKRLGRDIGKGLEQGLEESTAGVKAQSDQLAEAALPDANQTATSTGVILQDTERSADIVSDSADVLSENNDNLISTTELNEAISDDTQDVKLQTANAANKEQELNNLREQEIAAKEQAVANAKRAASESNIPLTSQSDLIAGDIGFVGPLTKEQAKENKKQLRIQEKLRIQEIRGKRREKVGRYSGKAAGGLGTAAMIAGVAGAPAQVTGALGAASMVTSMAPALAGMGPVGIAVGAIAAVGVGLKMLDKTFRDAAVKQAEYVKSISATTEKMKAIGEITGKVGASEIMARRREGGQLQGYNEAQRKGTDFGQKFLQEESGKAIQNAFSSNMMKVGAKRAAETLSFELSQYISDGVMSAEDANSIAYQIGVNLGDATLTTNIQGSLRMLVGPNGENLLKDPLNARMRIVSMADARSSRALQEMYDAQGAGNSGATEAAQLSAYSSNTIQVAQAQSDAIAVYAEKQRKVLEAELAITTNKQRQIQIQNELNRLVNMQVVANAKIAASIANAANNFSQVYGGGAMAGSRARPEDAFFDASKADVRAKYKGTEFEDAAQRNLDKLARADESNLGQEGGRTFEAKVQFIMASGVMNPSQIESMLKIFEGDLNSMDIALNVGIRKLGSARMGELTGLLSGVDKKIAKTITLGLVRKNPSDFDKTAKALALLQASDGYEVNMEAYVKTVGLPGLELLASKLDAVENLKSPITRDVVIQYGKDHSVDVSGLIANWDYYANMDPEVRKEAIQTYTMITDAIMNFDSPEARAEWARRYAAQEALIAGEKGSAKYEETYKMVYDIAVTGDGAKVAELLTNRKYGTTTTIGSKDGGKSKDTGGEKKKNPLDFLDSLATRIKNVRDGAFNATNPLKSMIAAFSGKQAQKDVSKMFTLFDGLQQRMIKMGVPKEFRDMIAGMSAEDFKAFASLPKGKNMFTYESGKARTKANITGLTKEGKAVMQTYREAQVGEFQVVQKEIVASVKDQDKAFKLLVASGMSASDALAVVEDKAVAAGIAAGAVGKKGSREMKTFIADTKAANDALSVQAAFNKARSSNAEFAIFKNAPELAKNMKAAGYSAEQIDAALADPDIAKYLLEDLKDGKIAAGDMKDYIDSIAERKSIDIKVGFAAGDWGKVTDEGRQLVDEMFSVQEALIRSGSKGQEINSNNAKISQLEQDIAPFQTKINEINQEIQKNQRTIEETYTRPIEVLQTSIEGLDRQLETSPIFGNRLMEKIQEQNSMYSNDLSVIGYESEKISEAYDKQLEALSQTKEINDEIIAQQGRQLGLADALTQGDIAAAARAAQEMRAANASQFANSQTTALERARANALGGLKGPESGMTQLQIEEAQYRNSQKLYAIETNPARVAILAQIKSSQDAIYALEQNRQKEILKIREQEDAIYKIQNDKILPLQNEIDKLIARNSQLQFSIDKEVAAIEVLGKNRDAWTQVNAKIDAAKLASKDLETAFGALLAGAKAIDDMWASILAKLAAYGSGAGGGGGSGGKKDPKDDPKKAEEIKKAAEDRSKILDSSVPTIQSLVKGDKILEAEKATVVMMQNLGKAAPNIPLTSQQVISARKQALGYLNRGGMVPKYFSAGGYAIGSDTVPAMLTPGEFVMSKYAVNSHGVDKMKAINNGSSIGDSVYNYNLSVNVKSDANPDQIAQAVMTQIRGIDAQRIRGSRI